MARFAEHGLLLRRDVLVLFPPARQDLPANRPLPRRMRRTRINIKSGAADIRGVGMRVLPGGSQRRSLSSVDEYLSSSREPALLTMLSALQSHSIPSLFNVYTAHCVVEWSHRL